MPLYMRARAAERRRACIYYIYVLLAYILLAYMYSYISILARASAVSSRYLNMQQRYLSAHCDTLYSAVYMRHCVVQAVTATTQYRIACCWPQLQLQLLHCMQSTLLYATSPLSVSSITPAYSKLLVAAEQQVLMVVVATVC
jgi:hypothetical protein